MPAPQKPAFVANWPLVVLTALIGLLSGCLAPYSGQRGFIIGSYNCENYFDTVDNPATNDDEFTPPGHHQYGQANYELKTHHLALALQSVFDNDTLPPLAGLGLCEIENASVVKDLLLQPELKQLGLQYVVSQEADDRGIRAAFIYRPSQFRLQQHTSLNCTAPSAGPSGNNRKLRPILYVTGLIGEDTFHLFINHWASQRNEDAAGTHIVAARRIKDEIARITAQQPDCKVIVMGDFNENPADEAILSLCTGQNALTNLISNLPDTLGTEYYKAERNTFDQILISRSCVLAAGHARTISGLIWHPDFLQEHGTGRTGTPFRFFTPFGPKGYSDHYPVLATFR
ncbi:MAG: hypothetical protein EBZ77_05515 [Chitinophagia bacterium]|nr:hypothetical protein [Chitinophagia bacterium]